MPAVDIIDTKKKKTGSIELSDELFGATPKLSLVHEALVMSRANARQGTAATKTRSFISGGGVKPFKQKGTGRARAGTIRSPLWRKGGTVFGPHPRDYSYSMPKKAVRKAMSSVLSSKLAEGLVMVVDSLTLGEPKTKAAAAFLKGFGLEGSTMLLVTGEDQNLYLGARNLPDVKVVRVENVNIFDLLKYRNLLTDKQAVAKLQEVMG